MTIWIMSDPHFGHENMLKITLANGVTPMRPFASVREMDEFIIAEHNKRVHPSDKVYCLGDVAIKREHIATAGRLNGHKRLVRGNHDIYKTKEYLPYFEEILAYRVFEGMILSHIPLHPDSLKPQWTNVHGHIHNNQPVGHFGPKYLNVCLEMTNYQPLSLEEVRERIKLQNEAASSRAAKPVSEQS